ncbi:MAG TPA: hypothetical protein VFW07_21120 [Parafilimonas sp.]|nr:hypothetical protein [Parafilimonas sp.]
MKKLIISALLLCCICYVAAAQIPSIKAPGIGSALSSLGNGLNPGALNSSFKMADWASSASKLGSTDASGAASLLGKLGKGLNTSSLMQGFSLSDWSSRVKSASTIASVATQAQSLIKNIKPDAFKSGFDPGTVTSALALLQK